MSTASDTPLKPSRRKGTATRVQAEPAFLLHRHEWSESSLVLDVFTRHHGRVPLLAKGARRPYSQLRSLLLPFQMVRLHYVGDGEVPVLRTADWAGYGGALKGTALLNGFYLNELLMKLLARGQAHPQLFDAYAATLPLLSQEGPADAVLKPALRAFELALLRELGWLPSLRTAGEVHADVQPGRRYAMHPVHGLLPSQDDSVALSGDWCLRVADALEACQGADGLQALQWLALEAGTPLKHNLRMMLQEHMGAQRLRTRQVLVELQRYPAWQAGAALTSVTPQPDAAERPEALPFPESEER